MTKIEFFEFERNALPREFLRRVLARTTRQPVYWLLEGSELENRLRARFPEANIRFIQQPQIADLQQEALLINSAPEIPSNFGQFVELWELIGTDVDSARLKFQFYRRRGYRLTLTKRSHLNDSKTTADSQHYFAPRPQYG